VPTIEDDIAGMKPKIELRKQEMNDITERFEKDRREFRRMTCGETELWFRRDIRRVLRPKKPVSKGSNRLKSKVRKPRSEDSVKTSIDCFLSDRNMKKMIIISMYGTIFWMVG
jgi:hypothetical protein